MQKEEADAGADLPTPDQFRAWLRDVLGDLGIKAAALGRDLGLGKNTLGDFLATPGRDLRLGTAAQVRKELERRASDAGKALAPMCGGANV